MSLSQLKKPYTSSKCIKPNINGERNYLIEVWMIIVLLIHWGRVTHICISELTIIGSDNGLSPGHCQAIIWNNAWLLLIEPLGTNVSEISIGIQTFTFKKMHLNMSSAKWYPFCLGLNVLMLSLSGMVYNKESNDIRPMFELCYLWTIVCY